MKPCRLIVTNDACRTLTQGDVRHYATMIEAAAAFVKASEPDKTVVFDDACWACELNGDEQRLLGHVCGLLGFEVEEVRG